MAGQAKTRGSFEIRQSDALGKMRAQEARRVLITMALLFAHISAFKHLFIV